MDWLSRQHRRRTSRGGTFRPSLAGIFPQLHGVPGDDDVAFAVADGQLPELEGLGEGSSP